MILNNLSGGGGSFDHNVLSNRSKPDQHPILAITGLRSELDGIQEDIVELYGKADPSTYQSVTLQADGWTRIGERYTQTVSGVAGVTETTPVVLVDVELTGTDLDADAAALEAWDAVSSNNVTLGAGTLTFYSYVPPVISIPVCVGVCG